MPTSNVYIRLLILAVAYYATGRIGLLFASHVNQVTLIWPPTGIAICGFLVWGKRMWAAIWLAAFLINLSLNTSILASMVIAVGNTLGPFLATVALTHFGFNRQLPRAYDVILFFALGVFFGMAINASIGTTTLFIDGVIPISAFHTVLITWWLGDALGALLVGSALLSLSALKTKRSTLLSQEELTLAWCSIILSGIICTTPLSPFENGLPPLITFPFVIWLGLRHASTHSAWAVLILGIMAIWGATSNIGPFINDQHELQLMNLWTYLFTLAITSQLITALRSESNNALIESQISEAKFRNLFENSSSIMLLIEPISATIVDANKAAVEFYGYPHNNIVGIPLRKLSTMSDNEVKSRIDQVIKQQTSHFKTQHILASGELRNTEVYPCLIKSHSGILIYAIIFDISERMKAEKVLRQYELIVSSTSDLLALIDKNYVYLTVNNAYLKAFKKSSNEVVGRKASALLGEEIFNTVIKPKVDKCLLGETINYRHWFDLPGLGHVYMDSIYTPYRDNDDNIIGAIATIRDITDRHQAEEKILHQAHFDSLTELPNRFLSLDRLSHLLNEANRNKELVAILFLDLDDFKKINDTLGHESGDKLLVETASRLLSAVRNEDTVGRLGGDEFIILLGGLSAATEAQPIAENLIKQLRKVFYIDNRELIITASIGIAISPADGKVSSELLCNADTAMYYAKAQGRNTFSYYTKEMNIMVSRRLAIEEQVYGALNRNEFSVYYQPKIDIDSGKIMGAEALLRWHNPVLGTISPNEFIPIAEKTGSIESIGHYVLTEALNNTVQWQRDYDPGFCIAVNLSPRQFRNPNLVASIKDSLNQSGLSAKFLEFEITEGVLIDDHRHINKALAALSDLGLNIAMDDFGTGYSSLSYLRSYPFNILKIDRSFIYDITTNSSDRELVNASIAMAHGLNLKVVAEGVETEDQLLDLKKMGCDYAQGFLFSKPLPENKMAAFLGQER